MIRRTITTMTLAAFTTIVVATAGPALAAPPSIDPAITIEPAFTVDPVFTIDPAITPADEPCFIETFFGPIPCPSLDWDLEGIGGSDEPADPVTPTVPVEVVIPDVLVTDIPLPTIEGLVPSTDDAPTDTPADEDPVIEEIIPLSPEDLADIRGVSDEPIEAAPAPAPESAAAPGVESGSDASGTVDSSGSHAGSSETFVPTEAAPTTTVAPPTTDTTPSQDVTQDTGDESQTVLATDMQADTANTGGGVNPMLAAALGAVAALAAAGATGAYRTTKRNG